MYNIIWQKPDGKYAITTAPSNIIGIDSADITGFPYSTTVMQDQTTMVPVKKNIPVLVDDPNNPGEQITETQEVTVYEEQTSQIEVAGIAFESSVDHAKKLQSNPIFSSWVVIATDVDDTPYVQAQNDAPQS